ncbi:MAG TPA: ABC transporter permease, partial [Gemmatimonadaceae bacterium]
MLNDLRYAVRQFARARAFTAVAVLTLAVGIGANTALFTFGNAVLARPLPEIRSPERLVWVTTTSAGGHPLMMSYPAFTEYRKLTNVFSDASAMADAQFSISTNAEPVRVRGQLVSGSYFDVIGVQMALGRGFLPEEDRTSGTHPVAVISHRLWRERFAADSTAIGRTAKINGRTYTIVGVTPERFNGLDHSEPRDVWVPLAMAGTSAQSQQGILQQRGTWWLRVVARLAPHATVAAAEAAVATQAARARSADTTDRETLGAMVMTVRSGMGPNEANDVYPVAMLAGAVTLLVLLIACANVSNLLLGRAVARRREIAVRLSLGASRSRVLRQLLTESVLLAAMGTAVGCLFASWATGILASIIPSPVDLSPDARVLSFTIVAAFFTGLGFGVVPALHATRADVAVALKDATVGFDRRRSRLQSSFVVAQVSLSLVLLVMTGMFLTALYKSSRIDVHFDASNRVLAASFDLGLQNYTTERADVFINQLRQRAGALPGVDAVSITNQVPMGERLIGADVAV